MKSLKLTGALLFLAIVCTSCVKPGAANPFYVYNLYLSIQDASGNDLVKGIDWNMWQSDKSQEENKAAIEKNKELYTLEIVFPEVYMDPAWTTLASASETFKPDTSGGYRYRLEIGQFGSYYGIDGYYLEFNPKMSNMRYDNRDLPLANKITYKLSFPSLFGDEEVHEIVTYWETRNHKRRQLCYRIEFDGKESTQITYEYSNSISFATVVLDR